MRDSIELEPAEFEQFLMNPKEFEDVFRLRGPGDQKDNEDIMRDEGQGVHGQ